MSDQINLVKIKFKKIIYSYFLLLFFKDNFKINEKN
jgi:hypothetical protein